MNALRLHAWGGPLRLDELPVPTPASGEVLVRVLACGVGLTVLNCLRGDLGSDVTSLPRVPGHEFVGTVTGVGAGVSSSRIGETVMAYFYLSCGTCDRCGAGGENLCERFGGYLGVDRDGGYAPWATLPASNALPLQPGLDPVLATAIPDAIATPVHVARRASLSAGDRVIVIGAGGGVGVHMVQVAKVHGATVLGLDVDHAKLRFLGDELGVDTADSSTFDAIALPAGWRSRGPDVVVDLLGSAASLTWALHHLRPGGRLVTLTTFSGVTVPLDPRDLVLREISVLGSRYAGRRELVTAAALVSDGLVRPVVGRRVSADHIVSLHDDIRSGRLLGRGALVWDD